jgi:nitrogen fixation protein FixH
MSRWPASMLRGDRWIPWSFVAFFALVLVANGSMIVAAFSTWPGLETTSAYQRGLAYNRMLAAATEQVELGWKVGFDISQDGARSGVIQVDLEDRFGNLIQDADVHARFVRPTHQGADRAVDLIHQTGGRYRAAIELPLDGQWDIHLTATSRGRIWRLSERIFLRP